MGEKHKLSQYKRVYCKHCYKLFNIDLAQRRGEEDIFCPECEKYFSIKEAEKLMHNISNITSGYCPNCEAELIFNMKDRASGEKIICPICRDYFYIDEVENPTYNSETKDLEKLNTLEEEKLISNYKTYVLLSFFLDFFFIFSIIVAKKSSIIERYSSQIDNFYIKKFKNWHTFFVIVLSIKIFLIIVILTALSGS